MSACEMERIRDGYVREALTRARQGEGEAAQALLDRAAQVWPLEPEQIRLVQRVLDEANIIGGSGPLLNPNRLRGNAA